MKSGDFIVFLIFLLFAGYFINTTFSFLVLPDMSSIEKWINLGGGILLVLGAFSFLSSRRYTHKRRELR